MLTTRVRWYQQIPLRAVENAITGELLGHVSGTVKCGPPPAGSGSRVECGLRQTGPASAAQGGVRLADLAQPQSPAEYRRPMTAVLDGIFDAHGGLDYWRSLSTIDVRYPRGDSCSPPNTSLPRSMRV